MLKFEDCCENPKNFPPKLLEISTLFKNWRNFILEVYQNLVHENITQKNIKNNGIVNPVIGILISEIITTLDGLYALASKNSFESIQTLTRKFLEISTQIIFILKDDSYNKALVYELKEISFYSYKNVETNLDCLKQVLSNDDKINKYYDKICNLKNSNKYYDWYKIYDDQITSFQKLYEQIDTNTKYPSAKNLWQKMYGPLSRNSHGFVAGKNLLNIGSLNTLNFYRTPYDISFSILVVQFMAENLINSLDIYYKVLNKAKIELFFENQKSLYHQIADAEKVFYLNTKRKLNTIARDRKRAIKKAQKRKLKEQNKYK